MRGLSGFGWRVRQVWPPAQIEALTDLLGDIFEAAA